MQSVELGNNRSKECSFLQGSQKALVVLRSVPKPHGADSHSGKRQSPGLCRDEVPQTMQLLRSWLPSATAEQAERLICRQLC